MKSLRKVQALPLPYHGSPSLCCRFLPPYSAQDPLPGSRYVQMHPAPIFVQEVCRQFQPCTWTQTNPTPGLTLTLTLTLTIWGARGRQAQTRGSAAYFGGDFPRKRRAAERPALTNKTRILPKNLWAGWSFAYVDSPPSIQ